MFSYFTQFGEVENCYPIDRFGDSISANKGFVIFKYSYSGEAVLKTKTHIIEGNSITCTLMRKSSKIEVNEDKLVNSRLKNSKSNSPSSQKNRNCGLISKIKPQKKIVQKQKVLLQKNQSTLGKGHMKQND
jgi:hypothetical protein